MSQPISTPPQPANAKKSRGRFLMIDLRKKIQYIPPAALGFMKFRRL